jgi:hypothetical protein
MLGIFIIPTGIGSEIGGHAGDASPSAKLISSACSKLIVNPNVVNASDINEMADNMLYVEGSMIDRFLKLEINLKESYQNKILVVANGPLTSDTVNAVNAARSTIGIEVSVLELKTPLVMNANIENIATGNVSGVDSLIEQVNKYEFDALAIHTPITVDRNVALNYFRNGGINPWGGIEAIVSKMITSRLDKPVAHAPIESINIDDKELYFFNDTVDPRIAPEAISNCFLHCVLKGLHKAPKIGGIMCAHDVKFLISPYGCFGEPHRACGRLGIPIIMVKENKTVLNDTMPKDGIIFVENYHEAAGIVLSFKSGISIESVRRPIKQLDVL